MGFIAWAYVDLFLCIVLEIGYSYAKEISMHVTEIQVILHFSIWLSWSVHEVCFAYDE
jgi:hypothetical protein